MVESISRRRFLQVSAAAGVAAGMQASFGQEVASGPDTLTCDALVYGSTPGGIASALEAARRGCRVILVCPKQNPGGMTASGLCTTDAVRQELFGGLVLEFINAVREEYRRQLEVGSPDWELTRDGWFYEPSVAERVFEHLLHAEADQLEYLRGHHLLEASVHQGKIASVVVERPNGTRVTIRARTFIDGTYEGDLAAAVKVPYRVGREGRQEHGESKAGIHYMNWRTGEQILTPDTGEPSAAIQAFCARCIFTTDPQKLIPFEKPANYDQHLQDYLPMLQDFESGRVKRRTYGSKLPRRKYQLNGSIDRLTSLNCPGVSWTWPEADRGHRARLERFHLDHAAGYVWFLQNHPGVPSHIRDYWKKAGLHKDEFVQNGHWPWQIYVRQGRRIEGRALVTQHNFTIDPRTGRTPKVEQPIAIGEHSFDVHPCHDRRYAVDGYMEGVLWYPKKAAGPAQPGQVPYGAMLPRRLNNLLVPVALSSTHIAMSVLRMEPLWMTTGQVAGLAAATAKESGIDAANLDPATFAATLKIKVNPYG